MLVLESGLKGSCDLGEALLMTMAGPHKGQWKNARLEIKLELAHYHSVHVSLAKASHITKAKVKALKGRELQRA